MEEKLGKSVRVWRVRGDSPGGIGISENSVTKPKNLYGKTYTKVDLNQLVNIQKQILFFG